MSQRGPCGVRLAGWQRSRRRRHLVNEMILSPFSPIVQCFPIPFLQQQQQQQSQTTTNITTILTNDGNQREKLIWTCAEWKERRNVQSVQS